MLETAASKTHHTGTEITSVPYSAIDRFEPTFIESWMKRVDIITRNTQFIGGEWIKKLESRLAQHADTKEARVCANGTDAIQLALRALGVGEGDIVLVPDSTFWATFEAVCNVGARPVTVDICPEDLHLNAALVAEAIDKFSPKAVIMVHLYGWVAKETKQIRQLCQERGVFLIEDSAQAWGATIDGKSIFADALVSTTSFYPGKVLGGAGDGGAVLTNDSALAAKMHLLANHGRQGKYEHHAVGWNSRLDVLQCAYLDLCLDFISQRIASRQYAAEWYRNNIHAKAIQFRGPAANTTENGYISVAFVEPSLRDKLMQGLTEAKIGYGVVYPAPMSTQPGIKGWIAGKLSHGNAARVCETIINLPCFAGMQQNELEYVKHHVERILK
ncbi:MAG: DegT/DnrJ/EryC1/StrS family aminotransferase [Gammaproteobacteria bacterium]|nr:DegT/DnrJ/EryC1/StrS family aminotransferase [Gammaproteobacteria bacterium]